MRPMLLPFRPTSGAASQPFGVGPTPRAFPSACHLGSASISACVRRIGSFARLTAS